MDYFTKTRNLICFSMFFLNFSLFSQVNFDQKIIIPNTFPNDDPSDPSTMAGLFF